MPIITAAKSWTRAFARRDEGPVKGMDKGELYPFTGKGYSAMNLGVLYPISEKGYNMALASIALVHQTAFADLVQKCADADFDFPENGSFVRVKSRGREFWYFGVREPKTGEKARYYVGPVDDPAVTARVEAFKTQKTAWRDRWSVVQGLKAAGLPSPPMAVGSVVAALGRAGLFRLHGVLVGSLAFQTYAGLIGVKLPEAALMTADIDFAQFHAVSVLIGDSLPPILETLRKVDKSYREIGHPSDGRASAAFANDLGVRIEFLRPNRGSDDYGSKPATMPALGGASAQPLRFLDFLIRNPVDSVLLHQGGVHVKVPAPERFAIHKMIVAVRRLEDANGRAKSRKDAQQAGLLIEALCSGGTSVELGMMLIEARERGPKWQDALTRGRLMVSDEARTKLDEAEIVARSLR